ncbi:DUF4349 domain-containing protein [Massilia rubra]|uniref:DUF4349 domain-containing protein n=1 Tax=Massilia rubra TaxID=2607910 RepID=A0ABX0LSJ3_9BURK|nr:DUF4349 domain-containing protein [Massilia rubra]NHZ35325.1 DUF4349 domain-containing protein [Massilia rubra]
MKILSGIVVAFFLCACSQKMEVAAGGAMPEAVETKLIEAPEPPGSRRYIATRHKLLLEAPEAELHKHFEAIQAACLKLACVVLNADQSQARLRSPANATLSARIPPQAFDSFLKTMLEHGKLLQHERDSEDLTAQVIDVEAKIANLTALKARILDLLAKRTGNLKEVLEAEKQLSETQSELDSISGQRKALASQTEMTRVELNLVAESLHAEQSWVAPVAQAIKESGHVLTSSLGVLITVVVAVLPWLLVLIPLFLWLRKLYRARKARRAQAAM